MQPIGFIGLGRMGQAMAVRVLQAGFPLVVYNRTRSKADDLVARGAVWVDSPVEVLDRSEMVLTILTDDQAVEDVYLGADGLLTHELNDKLLIEMSTIRTSTLLRLRTHVESRDGRLLDAPISGTVEPARQGQLMVLVGGSPEDLEQARPILESFSRRIIHMGPNGAGTTMKLVLNMPMAIFWAGLAEAMTIGRQFGLSINQMLDVYLDSPAALPALRAKAPLLRGAPHEVSFNVTGVRKDLLAMIATGQDAGVPSATGAAALATFAAATAAGFGERDLAFVVEYMLEQVGKTFPRTQE